MEIDSNILNAIAAGKAYEQQINVTFSNEVKAVWVAAYLMGMRDAYRHVNKMMEGGN